MSTSIWELPKIGDHSIVPLNSRILIIRTQNKVPLISETPIWDYPAYVASSHPWSPKQKPVIRKPSTRNQAPNPEARRSPQKSESAIGSSILVEEPLLHSMGHHTIFEALKTTSCWGPRLEGPCPPKAPR